MRKSIVLMMAVAGLAYADSTWTGGGTDAKWSTTANWADNQVPSGGTLYFGGSVRLTNTNDLTGLSLAGISFQSDAGAFKLAGNEVGVTSVAVNNSSTTQHIAMAVNFTTQADVTATTTGLYFDGALKGAGFTKWGNGTVYVLGDTSELTGAVVISNKTLQVSGGTAGFPGGIVVSYDKAAMLAMNSSATIAGNVTIYGISSGSAAIDSQGVGFATTNTINGKLIASGQIRLISNSASPSVLNLRGGIEDLVANDGAIFVLNSNNGEIRVSDKPITFGNRVWYQDNKLVTIAVAGNTWSWFRRSGGETRMDVTNGLAVGKAVQLFGSGILNLNGYDQQIGNLYGWWDAVPALIKSIAPAVLTVTQGADANYTANLDGAVTIRKQGNSTLVLSGTNNTQTGRLIVDVGRLAIDRVNALGVIPSGTVADKITIGNGATFFYQDLASVAVQYSTNCPPAETIAATQGISVPSGTGYLRVGTGRTLTVAAPISGGGTLVKNGDGKLVADPSLFGIPLSVTAGTLALTTLPTGAQSISVSSGASVALAPTASPAAVADLNLQNISFLDGAILALDSSLAPNQYLVVQGVIANPASGASLRVDKIGAGTALISDSNTFTGGVYIKEGTLSVSTFPVYDEPSPLGIASTNLNSKLVLAGGVLEYSGTVDVATYRRYSLSNPSNVVPICVKNAGTTLELTSYDYCSIGDTLIKTGAGTLKLDRISSSNQNNRAIQAIYLLGGTLDSHSDYQKRIQQNVSRLEAVGPVLVFGDGTLLKYNTPLQDMTQGGRQLVKYVGTQTRATIQTGNLTFCGPTNAPGNTFTFDVSDGADDTDLLLDSGIDFYSGSGTPPAYNNFLKAGAGTFEMSRNNSILGLMSIRAGRMLVRDNIPAGGVASPVGKNTNTYGVIFGDALTVATDRPSLIYKGSSAFSYVRGTYIYTNAYAQVGSVSNIAVTINANFLNDGILGFCSYTMNDTFAVNCAITGIGGLAKTGPGIVNLNVANSYAGKTIVEAGTLKVNADGAIPNGRNLVMNGGSLNLNGRTVSFGTLTLGGTATIDAAKGLVFSNSSAIPWTGKLTFANRTKDQRIYFGATSSGLTPQQLALVTVPAGYREVKMASDGELVFVPNATLMILR